MIDPKVRFDGRCSVCLEQRPPVAVAAEDPFCSNECCREFYGVLLVDLKGRPITRQMTRTKRQNAQSKTRKGRSPSIHRRGFR